MWKYFDLQSYEEKNKTTKRQIVVTKPLGLRKWTKPKADDDFCSLGFVEVKATKLLD